MAKTQVKSGIPLQNPLKISEINNMFDVEFDMTGYSPYLR